MPKTPPRRIVVFALCLTACGSPTSKDTSPPSDRDESSGDVSEPQDSGTQDPTGPDTTPDPPGVDECEEQTLTLAPGSLRRLTPAQYNRSVAALFSPTEITAEPLHESTPAFGFTNFGEQQTPSALVIQEFQSAAVAVTAQAMSGVTQWSGCSQPLTGQSACLREFLQEFIARAFRRPQTSEQLKPYLDLFDAQLAEHNEEVALSLTLQAVLQAPSFLYVLEQGRDTDDPNIEALDDHSMAARLSLFLWDSLPDATLRSAAEQGKLSTREQIIEQAERMVKDPQARPAMIRFFNQWLDAERIERVNLDPATYPSYTPQHNAILHEGLERRVEHAMFDGPGTLNDLLTSNETWVNADLAQLYGIDAPSGQTWALANLPNNERAGLLTDVGWLASRAHAVHPSPVARGVFVLERLLCQPSYPPPADADTTPPKADPQAPSTNRERYEQHVLDPTCAGCHKPIDGIGMGFENYDSFGRWRDTDNGFSVDASGVFVNADTEVAFNGALELSTMLGESSDVHDCVAQQLARYALGRELEESDQCELRALQGEFAGSQGHLLEQLVATVASPAFRFRKVESSQ